MTNLEAEQGRKIYFSRMKIDETFRDLKSLLGMSRLMKKQQVYMEKMLALQLLVYAIGILIGEGLRDYLHAVRSFRSHKLLDPGCIARAEVHEGAGVAQSGNPGG